MIYSVNAFGFHLPAKSNLNRSYSSKGGSACRSEEFRIRGIDRLRVSGLSSAGCTGDHRRRAVDRLTVQMLDERTAPLGSVLSELGGLIDRLGNCGVHLMLLVKVTTGVITSI
jgi:hypothetical protein